MTYLGEFHCNKNRAKYVSLVSVFVSLSGVIRPLLGLIILTMEWKFEFWNGLFIYAPWRVYLLITSSISLFSFILINFLPESPKFLLSKGRAEEALAILKEIYYRNNDREKFVGQCVFHK